MIDTRTEELAALYVLDLLEETERSAFESQLAGSDELSQLVRELSMGLHDRMRQADGPARFDLLPSIHRKLGLDPVSRQVGKPTVVAPSRGLPWSYIWAAAAGLLLVMNMSLLLVVGKQSAIRGREVLANKLNGLPTEQFSIPGSGKIEAGSKLLQARIQRLEDRLREREAQLKTSQQSQQVLEKENREVKTFNDGWQREYMRLAARFLPFFESNDGMTRFTVIEMVDSQAFDEQRPRRGFAELAGQFLSGEANIAGTGDGEFVGPVVSASTMAGSADLEGTGLQPVARGTGGGSSADTTAEAAPAGTSLLGGSEAMGFTVWRDDEQKGFLDIYNLPTAPDGTEPFLWVRSSDLEDYRPVGFLPELENGTGSLFYSVDEPNFTPVEIIITAEDATQPGSNPSGGVLLRGP